MKEIMSKDFYNKILPTSYILIHKSFVKFYMKNLETRFPYKLKNVVVVSL